jgi:hypothetical protein
VTLYRVFPYDASAAPNDRGGALFVPPSTGRSRIDNSDLYDVLYTAVEPHGAIAETFGQLPVWRSATFTHAGGRPYALATLNAPDDIAIFELDNIDALRSIGISRPTKVVTRDREVTQAWARAIFQRGAFAGARWWSYYNPDWSVVGFWDYARMTLVGTPAVLAAEGQIVREAASQIVRQIAR